MFTSELFKKYVISNTTPQVIARAEDVIVENLIVGKLGITANARGTILYKVNIVLYEGQIHKTTVPVLMQLNTPANILLPCPILLIQP